MSEPKLDWERIKPTGRDGLGTILSGSTGPAIHRTPILGGWLVYAVDSSGSGLTFVPDPGHEWDGASVKKG